MLNRVRVFLFALLALSLFACSGSPNEETTLNETVGTKTESVIRDTFMYVQPGELQMVSPRGNLYDDRNNSSTTLIHVNVLVATCTNLYSTTFLTATLCVSQAIFNDINSKLAMCYPPNTGHMWFSLYYDDAGSNSNKSVFSFSYGVL